MHTIADEVALINRFKERAPVDVETLAMALGAPVEEAEMDDDISGVLEKRGGRYRILVNAGHAPTRKRFTIAHELGHFLLHRHLIDDRISDTRAYRTSQSDAYRGAAIGSKQETEANRFAANLLMPTSLINRLMADKRPNDPLTLARELGVSRAALKIKLESMGLPITDDIDLWLASAP